MDELGVATLDRAAESLISPFRPAPDDADAAAVGEDASADTMVADVDILVREAREREEAGDFEVALKNCEEALRRDPEHEEALSLSETLRPRITLSRADEFLHPQHPRTGSHPRDVRILPKSRDFH